MAGLEEYCRPDAMRSFPPQHTNKPLLRNQKPSSQLMRGPIRTSGARHIRNLWQEAVRAGSAFLSGYWEMCMNMQIPGTLKCQDTAKAPRCFGERRIPFQFVDLTRKGLSKGES